MQNSVTFTLDTAFLDVDCVKFVLPVAWAKSFNVTGHGQIEFMLTSGRVVVNIDTEGCRTRRLLRLSWGDGPRQHKVMQRSRSELGDEFFVSFRPGRRQIIPITISLVERFAPLH